METEPSDPPDLPDGVTIEDYDPERDGPAPEGGEHDCDGGDGE